MLNILILNWNSSEDVADLMLSLSKSIYREFRVLLIHNASHDKENLIKTYNEYKDLFEMHFIENESNLGFAGGNNRGFEYLQLNDLAGDLLILNPDIMLQPDTVEAFISAKNKTNAGALMIRTFDQKGKHLYDGIKLDNFKHKFKRCDSEFCATDYAAGSCLYLDRESINNIGLFDDEFFMYWEEVDLSFRLKELGKEILCITTSYINRKSNPSEKKANAVFFQVRNSFLLKKKYKLDNLKHYLYLLDLFLFCIKHCLLNMNLIAMRNFFRGL